MQQIEYSRAYAEITRAYSETIIDGRSYFFKHPTQIENFDIYDRYHAICEHAKLKGLQTEDQKIETAIAGGWWTRQKEDHIEQLKTIIKNLHTTKERLLLPSQKKDVERQIERNEMILLSYGRERREAVGYTVEQYANERFQDETILKLTYKNRELTELVFGKQDEYYYLSDDIVDKIRKGFDAHAAVLSVKNIKLVAATGFFQNLLYIAETDPFNFWGKPVAHCSKYQIDLLIYGKMIKNLIKYRAESGDALSDETLSDPEKLVAVMDAGSAASSSSGSSSSSAVNSALNSNSGQSEGNVAKVSSIVGATSEDLKKMGVKIEKIGGKSLLDLAKENGGKLDKADYLSARLRM